MIRRALALLAFAAAPAALGETDVVKGLQNLTTLHRVALATELGRLANIVPPDLPRDPWGTRYEVRLTESGYIVASAGSDRRFDEATWGTKEQFTGLEGDVVLADANVLRTNRRWLQAQVTDDVSRAAYDTLRHAEVELMVLQAPMMRSLMLRSGTEQVIAALADRLSAGIEPVTTPRDLWGTPLRVIRDDAGNKVRIISAGADGKFDAMSWTRPPTPSVDEDIIYEDGKFTRAADRAAILRAAFDRGERAIGKPLQQPPDTRMPGEWPRVGGDVKAPSIRHRVEPKYDHEYRRAGITGIVIVEALISEAGEVKDVRIIKSLAPELDLATAEAVRQWTFGPATIDGKPTPVLFNLTVNFKLTK